MATIKSFTDLPQSEVLAKILPHESADAYYEPSMGFCTEPSEVMFGDIKYAHPRSIRCWSLAALLGVLPNENMLVKTTDGEYYCLAKDVMTNHYDNPVDACYGMILKLHELKML